MTVSRSSVASFLCVAFALIYPSGRAVGQLGWAPEPVDSPLEAELEAIETELARATTERDRVQAELSGLEERTDEARRRLVDRFRALYRLRRAGALPLAGGFDALLAHQARIQRLERMVVRDARGMTALRGRALALREELNRQNDELAETEERATRVRDRQDARERELQALSAMIEEPSDYVGGGATGGFGVRVHGEPTRGFAAERGRLPLPVAGSAQLADATREGGAGLALTASNGVTVRAVYRGRVAFGASHPGYGRLVIVDHGDNHYSVYGGLGAIGVRVGQTVDRDSVLGLVGPQPLFFQVRRGTRPLDARAWLGL